MKKILLSHGTISCWIGSSSKVSSFFSTLLLKSLPINLAPTYLKTVLRVFLVGVSFGTRAQEYIQATANSYVSYEVDSMQCGGRFSGTTKYAELSRSFIAVSDHNSRISINPINPISL